MPHGQACNRRSRCFPLPADKFAGRQTPARPHRGRPQRRRFDLYQITSQARSDGYSIPLTAADFERGRLVRDSFIRPNRLFTIEQSVILYAAGKVKPEKLDEVRAKIRELFA
jgi:hypothetical protein